MWGPFLPGGYYLGIESEFDPVLGWKHRPGFTGGSRTSEFAVRFSINSHGLRDEEVPYEKPSGQLRVLMLGDSFLAAPHVSLDQIMPKQLQALLRNGGAGSAQAVNAGVSGYGTVQEYIYLQTEGYKYSPDLVVVVVFLGNDILDNARTNDGGYDRPFFELDDNRNPVQTSRPRRGPAHRDGLDGFFARHSTVYNFAQSVWQSRWEAAWKRSSENARNAPAGGDLDAGGPAQAGNAEANQDFQMYQLSQSRKLKQSWDLTRALLVAMADQAEKMGARLVVVGAPSVRALDPEAFTAEARRIGLAPERYDPELPSRLLRQIAAEEGLPELDLLPILRRAQAAGTGQLYFPINKHWTPAGHRVVAQAVYEFLAEQRLLPVP